MNSNFLHGLCKYVIFFCSVIIFISCSRNKPGVNNGPITIHLFKYDNSAISVPIDKNDKNGWKPLLNVDLSKSNLIIDERDIINYDWSLQKITLTSDLKTRLEYNDYSLLGYAYFVIALGEKPVVGGTILPNITAVGVRIPVLFVSDAVYDPENIDTDIEMVLREHSYFHYDANPLFLDDLNKNVRTRLLEIGKLVE